jgi:hypothetical protein
MPHLALETQTRALQASPCPVAVRRIHKQAPNAVESLGQATMSC